MLIPDLFIHLFISQNESAAGKVIQLIKLKKPILANHAFSVGHSPLIRNLRATKYDFRKDVENPICLN